jgi:hypothetical protein
MNQLIEFLNDASTDENLGIMRKEVDDDLKTKKKLSSKHLKTLVEQYQESPCDPSILFFLMNFF